MLPLVVLLLVSSDPIDPPTPRALTLPPLAPVASQGAPPDDPRAAELGVTVVTPGLFAAPLRTVPFTVDVVDRDQLRGRSYRTLPQALRDTTGVVVQETSHGQGSPYIRGWTGFRNVLLVDGVRVNNSVFRDGPNQYWNTVDVYSIERLEVVKGPGSVLYGSDAIGGTVNAITRSPWAYLEDGDAFGGSLYYRVHSAEESHIGRAETSTRLGEDTALGLGVTGKHFGDYQAGEELGTQPYTGYDEYDVDLKLESYVRADTRLLVGHQRVKQNDVPRTHQTVFSESWEGTTVGSDLRRDLDQDRVLTFVQLHGEELEDGPFGGVVDGYSLGVSWHTQEESRDRIRSNGNRELQGFEADTLGLKASATAPSSVGRWTFGFDWSRDFVDSFSTRNAIQGPVADDAEYDLLGVFVQDVVPLSDRVDLTAGLRGQYAAADANNVSDPVTGNRISIDESWSALVGSLRATYAADEHTRFFAGVSQGFRAPNLSDLSRFDTARTDEFEIPSPDLDPETFVSYEVGVRAEDATRSGELSVYYTDVRDLIIRRPTGNTNSNGEAEITKENAGDGFVVGLEASAAWRFHPAWQVFAQTTLTDGEIETFPTSAPDLVEEPIDRLLPWFGHVGLRYDDADDGWWGELLATYATEADELSTRDQGDTSRIPPGGTPGYVVFDLHGGWDVNENVRVDVGLENILDEDYRVHGSGQNRPGRGVVVGLTLTL